MKTELPQLEDNRKTYINKTSISVALCVIFAGAFFVAGIRYERSHKPVRLPANQACLAYADAVTNALDASQSEVVAVVRNKEYKAPDLSAVKKQLKDCKNTVDTYSVTLQGGQK